jgi:ABC-type sugar transport system ATPase subunit
MDRMFKLILPDSSGNNIEIEASQSVLFVGANGAGKTRLGTWVEFDSPQKDKVHRISAQKSLTMPESSSPISIDLAEKGLFFGHDQPGATFAHKLGQRWGSKPAVSLLNDFQKLMVFLFSEDYEKSTEYRQSSLENKRWEEPPKTKLDILKTIWEDVLPHRELIIGGGRIETSIKGDVSKKYNASEMSDGERVMFYLIGQCLSAPKNGIIVIDEPELHLHKSVQITLWNKIELERPDCLFVYLTHDVEFAASKGVAKRIWVKSFDGTIWDWEEMKSIDDLPEELIIEILGSRKPIIFIEGENGSHDVSIYRALFNDFLIIPRGSCTQVIQSVKVLKESQQFHHLSIHGIIDRDRRNESEISCLNSSGIFVLEVAEVENLFCTPEIIKLVARKMALDEENKLTEAINFAFTKLSSEIDNQISLKTVNEVKFRLNLFNDKSTGISNITNELARLTNAIDVEELYTGFKNELDAIVSNQDYLGLLKLYNRKTLSSQMSSIFGLSGGGLPEYVVRLTKTDSITEVRSSLEPYFKGFYDIQA